MLCTLQLQVIRTATITYRPYHRNYYHSLAEAIFAVHSLSCTYYGFCSYGDGSDMHAIFLDSPEDPFDWDTTLPSAVAALQCLTPQPIVTLKDCKLRNKARREQAHVVHLLPAMYTQLVAAICAMRQLPVPLLVAVIALTLSRMPVYSLQQISCLVNLGCCTVPIVRFSFTQM